MGMIALVLAFAALLYLIIWKKWSTFAATMVASLVLIVFDGMNIWEGIHSAYAGGLGSSLGSYLLLLTSGALFGHMMAASGCALKISNVLNKLLGNKNVGITLFFLTAVMVYGGISVLVVIFTVGPVGLAMIKEANLPRRFLYSTIMGAGAGFVMTSMPATPSLTNLIPTSYLGTTAMAAPVLSVIGSVLQVVLCLVYLRILEKHYKAKGMGFEDVSTAIVLAEEDFGEAGLPSGVLAFLPTVILIGSILFLSDVLGSSTIAAVLGAAVACVVVYLLNMKRFSKPLSTTVTEGLQGGLNAVINLSAMIGFGVVIQRSSAFVSITDFVNGLSGGGSVVSVLLALFAGVSIFVATTASAGSGLDIFWQTMGDRFIGTGVNPELLHRISCMAAGGMDSMPHNSAYPIFNGVCGSEFRHTYPHQVVLTLIIPLLSTFVCIFLAGFGLV